MERYHCILSRCRLCRNSEYKIIAQEIQNGMLYSIARCLKCSLVFILETHAPVSPEYTTLSEKGLDDYHIWLQTKHKELAFRQFVRLLHFFHPPNNSQSKRKLLDVGCGIGGWLEYAKADYECFGFDASPVQSRYASQRFPWVRCATNLREYQAQLGSILPNFDLITLWDVLEHIREPLEMLIELVRQLSPTGLFYASTPSALPMVVKSRLHHDFGLKVRFSWNPREHVSYYSPKTLHLLCKEAGLQVLRMGAVSVYPRRLSAFEIFRRIGFFLSRPFTKISPQIYVLAAPKNGSRYCR